MAKLINYFKTLSGFKKRLEMNTITVLDDCAVFIEDVKAIWVKGHYYSVDVIPAYATDIQIETKDESSELELIFNWKEYDEQNQNYVSKSSSITIPTATSNSDGLMSAADKEYFDTIPDKLEQTLTDSKEYTDSTKSQLQSNIDSAVQDLESKITDAESKIDSTKSELQQAIDTAKSEIQNTTSGSYVKKSGDTMTGNLTAPKFIMSGGSASSILMADGSTQSLFKSSEVTTATNDSGTITPKAMNDWTTKTFVSAVGVSGNNIAVTKNGSTSTFTVPYATSAGSCSGTASTASKTSGTLTISNNGNNLGTFNGSSSPNIDIFYPGMHLVAYGLLQRSSTASSEWYGSSTSMFYMDKSGVSAINGYTWGNDSTARCICLQIKPESGRSIGRSFVVAMVSDDFTNGNTAVTTKNGAFVDVRVEKVSETEYHLWGVDLNSSTPNINGFGVSRAGQTGATQVLFLWFASTPKS